MGGKGGGGEGEGKVFPSIYMIWKKEGGEGDEGEEEKGEKKGEETGAIL